MENPQLHNSAMSNINLYNPLSPQTQCSIDSRSMNSLPQTTGLKQSSRIFKVLLDIR